MSVEAESEGVERKSTALFPWWVIALFILCFAAQFFIQTQVVQFKTEYDHDRNLMIAKGLSETGILSFLGKAYVGNPPLYYAIHAIPMALFGFNYVVVKLLELLLFFGGAVIAYLITLKVFESRKAAVLAFLLSGGLTWTAIYASAVRFYSVVFFFASLLIYAYVLFLEKQSWKRSLFLGSVFGLCMLTKDSFAFVGFAICLHFALHVLLAAKGNEQRLRLLKFGIIAAFAAIIVYSPWIFYLNANGLQFPWDFHKMEASGDLPWGNRTDLGPFYNVFVLMFQNWPVMTFSIFLFLFFSIKAGGSFKNSFRQEPLIWVLIVVAISTPLVHKLILKLVDLHQAFFVFAPLPILASGLVFGKKTPLKSRYLRLVVLTALILSAAIMSAVKVQQLTMPMSDFMSEDSWKFMDSLTPADAVAVECYSTMNVFTKAYAEYFPHARPEPVFFILNGVDYYMHSGLPAKEDIPDYIERVTTFYKPFGWCGTPVVVFSVNKTLIAESLGLECAGRLKLEGPDGRPARQAQVTVANPDAGWSIPYVSGNDGMVEVYVPKGSSGNFVFYVKAIGFKEQSGTVGIPESCNDTMQVSLSPTSKFFHGFNESRY